MLRVKLFTHPRWTLVVTCFSVALVIASMISLTTALGEIALATLATQTQLAWVVDAYTLVLACFLLPAGAIGDRYGRRGCLIAGLAIFTLASFAPVVSDSPGQLIIWRAVAGLGAAFIMPSTLSLLTTAYPPEQRLKAVGIWAAVVGSGAAFGMLGSGALLEFWSWQSIFWALGALSSGALVMTCTLAPSRDPNAPPVDAAGALLVGAAMAIVVYGVLQAPAEGWTNPMVLGCLTVGAALSFAFWAVELRRRRPLLDVRLFKDPAFTVGVGTIFIVFMSTFGFFYLSIQYEQLVMGYSALWTAVALSPFVFPLVTLSALSFWILPRLGLRFVVCLGLLVMAAGFIGLSGLSQESTYLDLVLRSLVLSSGIGLCTAPTTAAIMGAVSDAKQGVASAVNDAAREMGAALGIALMGSILASSYRDNLGKELGAYPEIVRRKATESLAGALNVASNLGTEGHHVAQASVAAFVKGMHWSSLVVAAIVTLAAIFMGLWAPGRDGKQLLLIRFLTKPRRVRGRRALAGGYRGQHGSSDG